MNSSLLTNAAALLTRLVWKPSTEIVRYKGRRTYRPSYLRRRNSIGLDRRLQTVGGKLVLLRRILKGRWVVHFQ